MKWQKQTVVSVSVYPTDVTAAVIVFLYETCGDLEEDAPKGISDLPRQSWQAPDCGTYRRFLGKVNKTMIE